MIINSKVYKRIDKKINLAHLKVKPMAFIYIRLLLTLSIFILLLVSNKYGYILAPVGGIIVYGLLEYICLDKAIIERMEILDRDALEYFPVFLTILKKNKNVKKAIEKTNMIVDNEISLEFKIVLENVSIGKGLDESLLEMNKRIPSMLVNNIISDLTESNRLGNNINESINLQLDLIKEKRRRNYITDLKVIPFRITIVFIIFVLLMLSLIILFNVL